MSKKKDGKKNNKNKKKKVFFLASIIVFIVVLGGGFVGYFYMTNRLSPSLRIIYKNISLPIVKIENGNTITSKQLLQDVDAVKMFYESKDYSKEGKRIDFSTKEGKIRLKIKEKEVLNKLIEDSIVRDLAQSKGIKISTKDVDSAVDKTLIAADSNYEKLSLNLKANYGWSVQQFKEKIVKNQLYLEELFKWYKDNLQNTKEYQYAKEAKESISKNGDNFDEVRNKFTTNKNRINQDNQQTWMEESMIIPEVVTVLKSMKEGEISDIIISPLGMHIVMLEKRRESKDSKNVIKKEVQLKQIFIRGKSFIDWIQEQKKEARVRVLLREYKWDSNIGEVDFSDANLRSTAKKVQIKSQGDPSL